METIEITKNGRSSKRPEGKRTIRVSLDFTSTEKSLIDAIKSKWRLKTGSKLSQADIIVFALKHFAKTKNLRIALEEPSLFKTVKEPLKTFPPIEQYVFSKSTVLLCTKSESEIFKVKIVSAYNGVFTGEIISKVLFSNEHHYKKNEVFSFKLENIYELISTL